MIRSLFLISTTGFWLTMMSLLIGREFFQFTPVQAPHEVLSLEYAELREEYQAIYLGQRRVGFGFTILEQLDEKEKQPYEFRHQSYLSFLLLGHKNETLVRGKVRLNAQFHLEEFQIRIKSNDHETEIAGEIANHVANIVIKEKNAEPSRKIVPLKEPVFYTESLDFLWTPENLKVGKRGRVSAWNPLLSNVEEIDFRVERKETITHADQPAETFVVFFERGGLETRSWVSPEGITLRRESVSGLLFQKEEAHEIFDAMRAERSSPPDFPNLFSIPSNQILKKPDHVKWLKARVVSPQGEKILEVKRQDLRELKPVLLPLQDPTGALAPYLAPESFLQSDDPEIQTKAREIVGGETSALRASFQLMRWVHEFVDPKNSGGIPSAKQVLQEKKGDCNEYTVLFTALARAAGIPARMMAGLVYQNGRFFYHAWSEVYLGEWIAFDPTFNEAPADATHLPLVEGNVAEQAALASQLGKIKIFILEVET